jgi:ligand-binding sensor domain-containing protein/two-component sensor histidine kinase
MKGKEDFLSTLAERWLTPQAMIRASLPLLALLLLSAIPAVSQQLSLRHYDVSDGLAHGVVTSICQDSKGYLWLSTFEGLSRFDGYRFVNYGTEDGLPHAVINHVTQDRQGRIWLATNGGGVARLLDESPDYLFKPSPTAIRSHKFLSFPVADSPAANSVNRMLFDSQDNLWCLTDFGIYCAKISDQSLNFEPIIVTNTYESKAAIEDSQGRLWFGLAGELVEISRERVVHHIPNREAGERLTAIIEQSPGHLLVATTRKVFEFFPDSSAKGQGGAWRKLPLVLEPAQSIWTMLGDRAGALWLGTTRGLLKYSNGKQILYSTDLDIVTIRALAEDRDGNLWAGSTGIGVFKLRGETILSYTRAEGLPFTATLGVFEDIAGRIQVSIYNSILDVVSIDGAKITLKRQLRIPPFHSRVTLTQMNQKKRWQVSILPSTMFNQAESVITLRNGRQINAREFLSSRSWVYLLEDTTGRLWLHNGTRNLFYADPALSGKLDFKSLPIDSVNNIQALIDDGTGAIWLGGANFLYRLRQGQLQIVEPAEGLPETNVRSLYVDSRGWLWVGNRYEGVSVTKDPGAEHPQFINYSTAANLSSNAVWAIVEDDDGKMYFGTGKGLDQFDPNTGQWRHYAAKDGLPGDKIQHLYQDRNGFIWVSTIVGVARFNPRAERVNGANAPIYLSRVQVAGEDLRLSETGVTSLEQGELPSERNNLLLEYVALSFQGEDNLRYQYRLEGVDSDWSPPTASRSVNYARLAPGAYRFLVRAIDKDGTTSPTPAVLQFRILSPVWQRWWFLTLAVCALVAFAYALYRYRLNQLLRLEHVRMRIATDLHDDIGSSLSQISILSEVARAQVERKDTQATEPLGVIAQTSRELVDSMSDIVWAINPKRDHLHDLVQRMRQFATDTLTALDIDFEFRAPDEDEKTRVGADLRREVFLIFKEIIHNLTRHSHCRRALIEISLTENWLSLTVSDDGCGFDVTAESTGHGLFSMQQRAKRLHGDLQVTSARGLGSTIKLKTPVK